MLLSNVNGLKNSFNPDVESQPILREQDIITPGLVADSSQKQTPEQEVKIKTLAKALAQVNQTTTE
ncbi:hypothetical protein [Adhaeribacter arboris]|nr:hypothetical protein [Adhaeribacter arboris]